MEVVGKKYALFAHPSPVRCSSSIYTARSTSLETTSVRPVPSLRTLWSLAHLIWIDQAPDQVPMFSDDESDQEDEYALDEVSSDVQIDPADMVGLPSDEDDDEDEDAGLVLDCSLRLSMADCIIAQAF